MWNLKISCLLFLTIIYISTKFNSISATEDEVPKTTETAKVEVEKRVLVLNEKNFKEVIANNEHVLVEFYAPWCDHCKALAEPYADAAKLLEEDGSKIKLAKVDATVETELAQNYQIKGYPTLKFFKNGNPIDYDGDRKSQKIVDWLKKKTEPPSHILNTVESTESFLNKNEAVAIAFCKDEDSEFRKIFDSVAYELDTCAFGIATSDEVFSKYNAKNDTVMLFTPNDEKIYIFEGDFNKENLINFIKINLLPLIIEFNHDAAQRIFGGPIKSHLLFFVSKKEGHIEKYVEPLKDIAKQHRNNFLFVTVNADEEDHGRIFEFFGMDQSDTPAVRLIVLDEELSKYKPQAAEITVENIKEFLEKFLNGELKQDLLSQKLPDDWNAHPVKVLVASNFDSVALDEKKDVLVEFYAPWCGHCNQLAPIYEKLGETYKDHESIVIAKMDATVNELEHTKIKSFPTIKLYRKGDNKVIDYNLDRKLEEFIKFLEAGGAVEEPTLEDEKEEDEEKPIKDEL